MPGFTCGVCQVSRTILCSLSAHGCKPVAMVTVKGRDSKVLHIICVALLVVFSLDVRGCEGLEKKEIKYNNV